VSVPLKPQRVTTVFARDIPNQFRILVDAGNAWAWFTHYFHRSRGHQHYHIAMGIGSMGWAIGASVGVCLGCGKPTVCITGDGSYLMSGQEITVALQRAVPVIVVVLNDGSLGMVKHGQRLGGAAEVGFELPAVDYALMAQAMGIEGIRIENDAQLQCIDWLRLGSKAGPTLIDVRIDGEAVPPMAQRVQGLAARSS
jgi:acetolactate synthase-1/2/3 large subunit